ncbi:MAG: InlB B-repeat-containing protein, partial [Clostridia bacterium]|nr:InlB B-repeat-containing protein [Clostridia bacterium]
MKKLWNGKRMLALLLTLVMLTGALPLTTLAEEVAPPETQAEQTAPVEAQAGSFADSLGDGSTAYFEVKFALPEGATTQEVEYTTLPETAMVPAGTTVGALQTPSRVSCLFLGWSYDESGTAVADPEDVIDRNLTLYPRFALKEGLENSGSLTYVSQTDVPLDFAIELISYGLTQEEIEQILNVEDSSLCIDSIPYTLTSCRDEDELAWLEGLGLDAETASGVWACVKSAEAQPGTGLYGALSTAFDDTALNSDAILAIVAHYAPQELTQGLSEGAGLTDVNGEPFDPQIQEAAPVEIEDTSALTESTLAMLAAADIDLATATEEELKPQYGLAEDDSLQRFWREDVGLPVEQVLVLEELLLKKQEKAGERWLLRPEDGFWEGGNLYSASIADTSKLRFVSDGEIMPAEVVEYNITAFQEEVVNISLSSDVIELRADEVEGVEFKSIINLQSGEDGELVAGQDDGTGVMTYAGDKAISAGSVIAVRDGEADANGFTDANVTYLKVTQVLGDGRYAYERAGVEDILFIADNIPVPDDGSPEDGQIELAADSLDFSGAAYADFGLDAGTRLEPGDYLIFYTGALGGADYAATGYGLVTSIAPGGDGYVVNYDVVSEQKVMGDELLLYMEMPEVDIVPTQEESAQLEREMRQQVMESGFVDETSDFLTRLIMNEDIDFDSLEHGDEIRNMTIQTDDGQITLEELRRLADGAKKVEVSDVHVTFLMFINLEHFKDKKGLRAEFAVSFTIKIAIGDVGTLEIQPTAVLEQEFLLTPVIKVKRNKNSAGLTSSLDITASFQAGTYTGLGVAVTAKTKNNPDPRSEQEWEEMVNNFAADNSGAEGDKAKKDARQKAAKYLIKGGNKLLKKAKGNQGFGADYNATTDEKKDGNDSKQGSVSPGIGGDLPTKYSNMLSNDAQYINFINKDLGSFDAPVDPMGIIHIGLKVNLTVGFKINCMIGAGISYENAKEFSYHFRAKIWGGGEEYKNKNLGGDSGSSVKDIKKPNFRADFYAFGMLGIRAGVGIDLRVGVFSTDLDSVGVVATAGIYAELYGFLYCWFEWTSGQGTSSGAMGSLLFEIGIYTDISVKVQVGFGKASKSWSLYSKKIPLLQLGCVKYPIDFTIEPNDSKLTVVIKDGENTVKVPDELFNIKLMALSSGKIANENMDSKHVCETGAKSYTADMVTVGDEDSGGIKLSTKRTWTQYNEDHFVVECFDLESNKGKVKQGPSSFQYLPATNEIYICPVDSSADQVWGKVVFTYKNNAFGFSTQPLQRTVYVSWKGTKKTASVEYYLQENSSADVRFGYVWSKVGMGSVSGYDGIRCYVEVTPELCNMFPGYELVHLGFPDEAELEKKYNQAYDELEQADKAMKKANTALWLARDNSGLSKAEKEAAQKAADDATKVYIQAKSVVSYIGSLYRTYYENNEEAIANKSGTTWFTMRGDNTVIGVYFKKLDRVTSWDIVGEDLAVDYSRDRGRGWTLCSSEWDPDDNALLEHAWHSGQCHVFEGLPVLDYMPDKLRDFRKDTHDTKWY